MASGIISADTSFGKIVERLLDGLGPGIDKNPGSIARTMVESYAREMALFYEMVELSHASGYLETAKGGALDNVVAILGIKRAPAGRLVGHVEFSRVSAAPDDISIPVNFIVMLEDEDKSLEVATAAESVLLRGDKRVVVPVQQVGEDPEAPAVVDPGKLTRMPRTILGIDAVTNPAPLRRNSVDESDDDLRARARVALREGEKGTLEAIASGVRKLGVQQVTVREPEGGPPGIVEVVIGDRDFSKDADRIERVRQTISSSKAAGIRVKLLYAQTVYFQPVFAIEPVDPNLDDAGFARLQRSLFEIIEKFGKAQPVGQTVRRRRFEAAIFSESAVLNVGDIKMNTFVWGTNDLRPEKRDRERDAARDWELGSLETAAFDVAIKPPIITRLRPPTYRFALTVAVPKGRTSDEVRGAVRDGVKSLAGSFGNKPSNKFGYQDLERALIEKAGITNLRSAFMTSHDGSTIALNRVDTYSFDVGFRLVVGSIEVVEQ